MRTSYRKIHLDFHTPGDIENVCADFNPDAFADTLAAAHVDGVVLFAKGTYGFSFFNSKIIPAHPHLKKEFLPLAAEACRQRGITTEAYINVGMSHTHYLQHPDWVCRNRDGTTATWGEMSPLLDMAGPVIDQVMVPYVREVAGLPIDGVWMDIVMYPNDAFYSPWLTEELKRRSMPDTAANRGIVARLVTVEVQRRLARAARDARPDIGVLINNQVLPGDRRGFEFSDVIDIETDPGYWPQHDPSLVNRYVSHTGKSHHGMTTRFHRCWGDHGGLRAEAELEFELGNLFAAGSACISIGDHLHPRGVLPPDAYGLIGKAYKRAQIVAPLVEGAQPAVEAALLVEPCADPYSAEGQKIHAPLLGAARLLIEEHFQFAAIDAGADVPPGCAMILPGGHPLPPEIAAAVTRQAAEGRPLIAFGNHVLGLEGLLDLPAAQETALPNQFLLYEGAIADDRLCGQPVATYSKAYHFQAGEGVEVLGRCMDPLTYKTPSGQTCTWAVDFAAPPRPAVVAAGNVILCGVPCAQLVHTEGAWTFLHAMAQLLKRLIPSPLVETGAGPTVEVALHRKGGDLIVHLVSCQMPRQGLGPVRMRQFEPIRGVTIRLRTAKAPSAVTRAGSGDNMIWDIDRQGLRLDLDILRPHEVIVCKDAAVAS